MEETDWYPLTHCPIYPGVYKTIHLNSYRKRHEGYSRWIPRKGWGYTSMTVADAEKCNVTSSMQSKQWKGLKEQPK